MPRVIYSRETQNLVNAAEPGGTIEVDTEGQKAEVEMRVREVRPFDDIKVAVVPRDGYDGERFIIELSDV